MKQVALGWTGPLVCGALAGMASWVATYPFDVCKTFMQNNEGSETFKGIKAFRDDKNPTTLEVATYLYQRFGISVFFDGLTPKLIRASVNHSVTFAIFNAIMDRFT